MPEKNDIGDRMSPAEMKIHQLIAALKTNSVDTRHHAVRELGTMGKSAVEPLIRELAGATDNDSSLVCGNGTFRSGSRGC